MCPVFVEVKIKTFFLIGIGFTAEGSIKEFSANPEASRGE